MLWSACISTAWCTVHTATGVDSCSTVWRSCHHLPATGCCLQVCAAQRSNLPAASNSTGTYNQEFWLPLTGARGACSLCHWRSVLCAKIAGHTGWHTQLPVCVLLSYCQVWALPHASHPKCPAGGCTSSGVVAAPHEEQSHCASHAVTRLAPFSAVLYCAAGDHVHRRSASLLKSGGGPTQ